uniref:Uncharacterized protein n=1 Tax=Panagrolaimus sp. ES5 TaxID=591445 RepID=A0AC34FI96_9BILA
MSSKTQHRISASNDIVTTKLVEQLNSLTTDVAMIKSDLLHHKETLQLEMRAKKSEVLQEAATKIEQNKRNFDQEIVDLRAEGSRENCEKIRKVERKLKALEETSDSKISEVKKCSQSLINSVKTEMIQNSDILKKEILDVRGELLEENSKLKADILDLKEDNFIIKKHLRELKAKLLNEEAARREIREGFEKDSKAFSNMIESLQKQIDKKSNETIYEIDNLVKRSNGYQTDLSKHEDEQKKVFNSLKTLDSKKTELGNEMEELRRIISKMCDSVNASLEKIPEKINEKFHENSVTYRDMLDGVKKENDVNLEAVKSSVEKISGQLAGKFSDDIHAARTLTQTVMEEVAELKSMQENLKTNFFELDTNVKSEYENMQKRYQALQDSNQEAQKKIQNLTGLVDPNYRVKVQVHEINRNIWNSRDSENDVEENGNA